MHGVQYVALSRADLQRWQNVRPHLMQAFANPARRRFNQTITASSAATTDPIVIGFIALACKSKYGYVPKIDFAVPLRAIDSCSTHASFNGGSYIATRNGGGVAANASIVRGSRPLARSNFCPCSVNFDMPPLATESL